MSQPARPPPRRRLPGMLHPTLAACNVSRNVSTSSPPPLPWRLCCGRHPACAPYRPAKAEAAPVEAKLPPSVKSPSAEAAEILATSGGITQGGSGTRLPVQPTPPAVTSIAPAPASVAGAQAAAPAAAAVQAEARQGDATAAATPAVTPAASATEPRSTSPAAAAPAQQPVCAHRPHETPLSCLRSGFTLCRLRLAFLTWPMPTALWRLALRLRKLMPEDARRAS